jgi:CubicO group peptidase (beta-lactamase class C family)
MNRAGMQELLEDTAARLGVVGAQLAVFDGAQVLTVACGYRNRELALPVTTDTLFQIGSTTKLFNAALVLSLVDAGRLDLDCPVCEYLPNFRLADVSAERTVTLRQLLSMSAGLDNGPYYDFGRGDDALGRYVEMFSGIPQVFRPGLAFGYSNAATCVAGHVAAHVCGHSWEKLLEERIWRPLGLSQSALFAEDMLQHPLALGYRHTTPGAPAERTRVWSSTRAQGPSGSLTCSSAGDLIALARMFLDQGRSVGGRQVLSAHAVDIMHTPRVQLPTRLIADQWCVGPYRKEWDGHALYGHSGTNRSGSSMLLWCPKKNIAIATLVNVAAQGYPLAEAIFATIFPDMFGIKKPASVTPQNVAAVSTDARRYAGRFEAFGMSCTFAVRDGSLRLQATTAYSPEDDVEDCELIPLGDHRFLPVDPRVSGQRNWDLAFWGDDGQGRPTHLLQGVFPLRRTS